MAPKRPRKTVGASRAKRPARANGTATKAPPAEPGVRPGEPALEAEIVADGASEAERNALVPSDALSRYMAELARYPLLVPEQERRLARRARAGDREAAQQLVLSNLRLVVKIAMEYRRVWANLLDLIQEGNLGLLRAVERFEPERGVKLSSYAAYWIRAYILKYLIDNIRLVRVGQSRAERKLFFQLGRVKRELEQQGLRPEPRLIAERLALPEAEVADMERRLAQGELSLEARVRPDRDAPQLSEFLASDSPSAEALVGEQDQRATLLAYVEKFAAGLDQRDGAILRERIIADPPRTLQEIGDRFGLTRERVRQLEKALVGRLREYLKRNLVDFEYWAPEDR
jgi:RNA polymerase sigma-32 factor